MVPVHSLSFQSTRRLIGQFKTTNVGRPNSTKESSVRGREASKRFQKVPKDSKRFHKIPQGSTRLYKRLLLRVEESRTNEKMKKIGKRMLEVVKLAEQANR